MVIAHAHQIVFTVLWVATCGYAIIRGGAPERLTAIVFLGGALLSRTLEHASPILFRSVETGMFLVDAIMLAVLFAVALLSSRFWPMLMAVFQGAQILVHVGRWLAPGIVPNAYFVTEIAWSFPMLLLLAVGTKRHRLRLARIGIDYSWAFQLPQAYRDGEWLGDPGAYSAPAADRQRYAFWPQ